MPNFRCEDCSHSFYVPGGNMPLVIQGGCPECGGNARPEPDQPSGTPGDGDGRVRNLVDPYTGDDTGGNPLQEGILGQTDGGWDPARKRDESFASVQSPHTQSVTPMRIHPFASNQKPQMPWQFEVEEVAEPGMDNEDAEKKMTQEKKAFWPLLLPAAEALGGALGIGGAAAGAEAGGAALGGSLLRKAVPSLMGHAMMGGAEGLLGNQPSNVPAPAGPPAAAPIGPPPAEPEAPSGDWFQQTAAQVDLPGGGTPNDFPKDTEDPEHVDPKEHNDGDNTHFQNDVSVNGIGGTDDPTPGLEAMQMLLPLVVHYAESPESGKDHPLMAALAQLLEGEGLMHGPEDPDAHMQVIKLVKGDGGDNTSEADKPENALPKTDDLEGTEQSDDGKDADEGNREKESATHQGPHSPEQIAAVQQLLMDSGRTQEVPNVPVAPWEYAQEMAEVAQNPEQPPQDVGAQPQPAQEEAPPEDTMPMPGMTAPPPGQFGTPTSSFNMGGDSYELPSGGEGQHFHCPNCHGQMNTDTGECYACGYTYPYDGAEVLQGHSEPHAWARDMGVPSMNSDWGPRRQGADSATPACPECGSHTTGLMNEDGDAYCHSCHFQFNPGPTSVTVAHVAADSATPACPQCGSHTTGLLNDGGDAYCHACHFMYNPGPTSVTLAAAHDHADTGINPQGVPAADQLGQEDVSQEQDPSGEWATDDGQPLIVGEQYELHTPGVDIPDIVRVQAVKPDSVTLQFTGAYELGFAKEISREEFNVMGYNFTHVTGDEPEAQASEDANNAPDTGVYNDFSGPGTGSGDLSTPHQVMTSWKVTAADFLPEPLGDWTERNQHGHGIDPSDLPKFHGDDLMAYTPHTKDKRFLSVCPSCQGEGCPECAGTGEQQTTPLPAPGAGDGAFTPHRMGPGEGGGLNVPADAPRYQGSRQPESFAGTRQSMGEFFPGGQMPGAQNAAQPAAMPANVPAAGAGGTQPGGQCAVCGGPLQPDGSCLGCERGAQAPGAGGTPPQAATPQSPQGGRPAAPQSPGMAAPGLMPGGAQATRPPYSTFSHVPSNDPETGVALDPDAQALIERLMRNAANDPKADRDERTAGAHYSPNEQRDLIDEEGVARNADKMDLSHTHYESRKVKTVLDADSFLW